MPTTSKIPPSWFVQALEPFRREYMVFCALDRGKAGSNKEILAELFRGPKGEYALRTRYGKVGSVKLGAAATDWRFPYSDTEFDSYLHSKTRENRREGTYQIVQLADSAPVAPNIIKKASGPVGEFLAHIYAESGQAIRGVLRADIGIGDISPAHIQNAKTLLTNIGRSIRAKSPNHDEVIRLSSAYYSIIPHETGDGDLQIPRIIRDAWATAVSSKDRLQREYDFLETLEAAVGAKAGLGGTETDMLSALGAEIKRAEAEADEIADSIKQTQGRHNFRLRVGRVFALSNPKVNAAFEGDGKKVGGVKRLFHGSRNANILGITSLGVRIKPSGVPTAGSMFGNGAYFADLSTKSAQYARHGNRPPHYLFVCEVALGKMKVFLESQSNLEAAPKGYDSVKGEAGRSLMNNEYIVYRESQSRPVFVAEIEFV